MDTTYSTPYGEFEWDSRKDAANRKKHGISFALATEAFADRHGVFRSDTLHSVGEERQQLLGQVGGVVLLLVVFTERNAIRIISARKATRQEKKFYVDANG
ncbi:BrnT family toxin [uncultured Desulfovibrio sp.]|uniref:BrnT family toxin n=1 Tax=uncultured Desulfovibrio sp. TaxID=167968 RepID=UPI0026051382|nr:BrnT family toxin [uncultured Desulfovibrio sp.]